MPWPNTRRLIGQSFQRLDGPEKATGRAKYSYDINRPNMLHARILRSPHARAQITAINTNAAQNMPGVRAVHTVKQANDTVFFAGEEIAAVAADTEEHAEDAIRAIQVQYNVMTNYVKEADARQAGNAARTVSGFNPANLRPGGTFATANFDAQAYQNVAQQVENTYGVPVICHQCLESHGLVAEWRQENGQDHLRVWASTQAVPGTANALAQHFNIPAGRVQCITHYMGGGFGSKFGPDIQGIVCAELARQAGAPVKLMLDRAEEITVGGNRPSAYGTVKAAADAQGNIRAYEVNCYGSPGVGTSATVNMRYLPYVYGDAIPFVKREHQVVRLNAGRSRAMRAPGHPQNCVLTEWIIDELAARLNLNPMLVRLRNLPENDPQAIQNDPFSFNALRHTIYTHEIKIARDLSDWDARWAAPGQNRDVPNTNGKIKHGIGMALHTWGGAGRAPNDQAVIINRDGSVISRSSTQDLGTGERTVLAITIGEVLGLDPTQITVELGESQFGRSTGSGGSTTTPATSPSAFMAANQAKTSFLQTIAQGLNAQAANLQIQRPAGSDWPIIVDTSNNRSWTWQQACARLGENTITGTANWQEGLSGQGVGGVQVAEVEVDIETGVVRCTKIVAVQDCGMIINKKGCESQVAGGVIMGLNYALFEERIMDKNTGRQVNPDMEFYKLAGMQDIPDIIVHMYDMPERGVIGIGEPPTISTCAAIGNALYNALGVRVPEAPFTPERVLAALAGNNNGGGNNQ